MTGGSGLVERYLASLLLSEDYTVAHLLRCQSSAGSL